MTKLRYMHKKAGQILVILAGLVIVTAIAFLAWNVTRKIEELSSASSDNVQWSLSQTEVEFQEFSSRIRVGADLTGIRRRFDIFYSRINTVSQAQVFEELRADDDFRATLQNIQDWLETTVRYIDSTDVELTRVCQGWQALCRTSARMCASCPCPASRFLHKMRTDNAPMLP
ncbi:hypothetical protein ACFQDZ_16795 [Sulfitobacter pacificus]|uniref:hypothetical protein n=1 Tax=Sulfitobacter pacificus TaxID=1499314 RepID=UPI003619FBC4